MSPLKEIEMSANPIYEFKKNALEKVVCQFREYKGKKLIDIRVFYLSEDGSWGPTKKGICFRRELINDLKEAINKAAEEWERELSGVLRDDKSILGDG